MENQDKLYQQFKDASGKAEDKGFDRMEAVWNRVEEKLDNKKQRKIAIWWKYTGIAALFLLFMGIGTFMFKNENNPIVAPKAIPENNVTVIDTQKVKQTFNSEIKGFKQEVVTSEPAPRSKVEQLEKTIPEPTYVTTVSESEKPTTNVESSTIAKAKMAVPTIVADKTVSVAFQGVVTDNTGMPIPGVNVQIQGTSNGVQTDFDGKYTLNANEGDKIVLSYIGMEPQAITASRATNNLTHKMQDNSLALQEVVVQGYRATTRVTSNVAVTTIISKTIEGRANANYDKEYFDDSNQSNSSFVAKKKTEENQIAKETVATVTSKAIESRPNANMIQTLQGQVPGLNISTGSGQPGANSTVILRGYGSINNNPEPLYVIDGVPLSAENFRKINPNDIIKVTVLKDARATGIYGVRGSNGVIIVKTKNAPTKRQLRKLKKEREKIEKIEKENAKKEQTLSKYEPVEVDQEEYESFVENQFENSAATPLSTFSIDVDNASYTNVRRFLNDGETVPKDAVRVEEMINFFKYDYPQPRNNDSFSISTEYSIAPWNPRHKLLKIGLKGKVIADKNLPSSNFVFLIDVSGSMDDDDKLPLLKESMKLLVKQMRKNDRIAIVVYAGAAGLVLPSTSGADKDKIIAALNDLQAGGSTAGGEGIELAYKTAEENFIKDGNNRIILATDGDFNVGKSSNSDMETLIEEKRKSGVFLTCLGYGMGNYKDSKMEILADKGNGNYAYIDNMQEATRFLDKEFIGSMYAIAKDVKIQIEFNPKHVQSYRLIGYENRKLRDEDFANDTIDAGELGSGHTVTALYEIIPVGVESEYFTAAAQLKYSKPLNTGSNYNNELATIKFRYKKPDGDKSTEMVQIIPDSSLPLQKTSDDYKFAAAVAWFGLKLRDSKLVPNKTTEDIKAMAKQGLKNDPDGYKAEFIRLVEMVK